MNWLEVLQNAGLPAVSASVNETGKVDASFSRELTPVEWRLFLTLTDPARARQTAAKAEAALAIELKSLTPAQAVAYVENNVTTLASAKVVLKIMARLIIAMRDEVFPDLPEA